MYSARVTECKYVAKTSFFLTNGTEYSVKNAKQFAEFISNQEVAEDELVVSFDVISLCTSIPIDMAIDIVQRKPEGSDDWKNHTQLTKDQILDLLTYSPFFYTTAISYSRGSNTSRYRGVPWDLQSVRSSQNL